MLPRGMPQRSLVLPEVLLGKRRLLRKQALPMQPLAVGRRLSAQALRHQHLKVRAAVRSICAGFMACTPMRASAPAECA